MGFLEEGVDLGDIMATIHTYSRYGTIIGAFPEWHPFVFRMLQLVAPKGEVGIAYIYAFARKAIEEYNTRSEKEKSIDEERNERGETLKTDYMSSLLAKHRSSPTQFKIDDAFYHIISNVVAGGETTGISLSAAVYLLIKHPRVLKKLRNELESLRNTESRNGSFREAQGCSYLQAVIKEALRLFPAAGLTMPRVVPKGGLRLCDRFFPEGVSNEHFCSINFGWPEIEHDEWMS